MAVDAETKKYLDEVKKGKPRRFAMICKGVKILNLIVYKKGSEEKRKKELKKADGSGLFFGGVVTGKGKNITFELSAEDYDTTPGKDLTLRQFLETEAGMSFKAVYELVDRLSPVDEADDDQADESSEKLSSASHDSADSNVEESVPEAKEASTASTDPLAPTSTAKTPGAMASTATTSAAPSRKDKQAKIAEQLMAALDEQRPLVDQAVEKDPSVEDDLLDRMSDIVDDIRSHKFQDARNQIGDLRHIVSHLLK